MTDRQSRAALKIRTAGRDLAGARSRLRTALVDGINTAPLRREIENLAARVDSATAELAELNATADAARSQRLSAMAATIAAEATTKIRSNLDRLRPPAPPKPTNEESKL